ncbi:unnamed protein product, partial [Ixodes persulcatus]
SDQRPPPPPQFKKGHFNLHKKTPLHEVNHIRKPGNYNEKEKNNNNLFVRKIGPSHLGSFHNLQRLQKQAASFGEGLVVHTFLLRKLRSASTISCFVVRTNVACTPLQRCQS